MQTAFRTIAASMVPGGTIFALQAAFGPAFLESANLSCGGPITLMKRHKPASSNLPKLWMLTQWKLPEQLKKPDPEV